ncbi:MAG: glycoside hydrolase family 2, partial [Christiangramia sp.]|nr:glycoside hydrolase family 2 [Christiangramia sp.]
MKIIKSLLLVFVLIHSSLNAQRLVKTINSGWEFQLENSQKSKIVIIPHTWNEEDAFSEGDYFRGKGVYSKQIFIPENWQDQAIFLKFEGANQVTKVFVNGKMAGEHTGGYTSFMVELSDHLKFGESNLLKITVDNSHNNDIPPLEADFNFY